MIKIQRLHGEEGNPSFPWQKRKILWRFELENENI
jgi:hypothetical protein